jgi:hypothetical protein
MKIEVTKDEEFVRSSGSRCEKMVELIKKHGEWRRVERRWWTTINVTDSEIRWEQLQGDGRSFKTWVNRGGGGAERERLFDQKGSASSKVVRWGGGIADRSWYAVERVSRRSDVDK